MRTIWVDFLNRKVDVKTLEYKMQAIDFVGIWHMKKPEIESRAFDAMLCQMLCQE